MALSRCLSESWDSRSCFFLFRFLECRRRHRHATAATASSTYFRKLWGFQSISSQVIIKQLTSKFYTFMHFCHKSNFRHILILLFNVFTKFMADLKKVIPELFKKVKCKNQDLNCLKFIF